METKKYSACMHCMPYIEKSHRLLSGNPATRAKILLMLLPSGPDMIRGMTPYGTECSSPVEHYYYIIVSPPAQPDFMRRYGEEKRD